MNALTRLLSPGMRDADERVAAALSPRPLEPVDRYLSDSLIVTWIDRATALLSQWWTSSATAALATAVIDDVSRRSAPSRYRGIGAILLIGVVVHIGLTLMQGPRPGWFWLVIPAIVAAFATLLIAGSRAPASPR